MSSPLTVPDDVRLRLAHGCLEHLARTAGVRMLHIKGAALDPVLAEGRAPSSDCDVLVPPAQVRVFTAALTGGGWERVTRFEHGSVFRHAATFYSPIWGTVDVHRSFPGLDRDAAAAFERLWERRGQRDLGGVPCAVPDLTAQRLLLLVHAARDAMGRREHDVRAAWTDADAAERARVDALADELGARVPLALVTERPELASLGDQRRTWQAAFENADATSMWRARLQDARGVQRLRVLWSAARVNPDHLGLRLGHAPSRREMRAEWWRRWGRALRNVRRRDGAAR